MVSRTFPRYPGLCSVLEWDQAPHFHARALLRLALDTHDHAVVLAWGRLVINVMGTCHSR